MLVYHTVCVFDAALAASNCVTLDKLPNSSDYHHLSDGDHDASQTM